MKTADKARLGAAIAAMMMVATACASASSGADLAAAEPTTTTTSAEVSGGLDRNPAGAAAQVIDAIQAEADAFVEPTAQHIKRIAIDGVGPVDSYIVLCAEERAIRAGTLDALPETIGDIRLDDAYVAWRDAYTAFVEVHAAGCDEVTSEPDLFAADEALFDEQGMKLEEANKPEELACLEALTAFAEYGRLNCYRESTEQPSINLEELFAQRTNDADPLVGPTGGLRQAWVEIPPGRAELAWFPRPFTIDHGEALNLQTDEDYVWITEAPDGATFGLYALDMVADPNALTPFEIAQTVQITEDLTDWFEALPVTVTGREEVEVGGSPATRWEFSPDRDATIEATGDVAIALAASSVHEYALIEVIAEFPEKHTIWHVRTSSGPVIVHVLDTGFGARAFADSVLPSLTFE